MQELGIADDLPKGSFQEAVRGFKRELVRSALAMHGGNRLKAAKELGISRCYLHRLLNQLNVAEGCEEEPEMQADLEVVMPEERPQRVAAPARVLGASARIA